MTNYLNPPIFADDEDGRWAGGLSGRSPFNLDLERDVMRRGVNIQLTFRTPAVSCHVTEAAIDQFPDSVRRGAEDLTRQMKRMLVERVGLEEVVSEALFKKLFHAANTRPPEEANIVIRFLLDVGMKP